MPDQIDRAHLEARRRRGVRTGPAASVEKARAAWDGLSAWAASVLDGKPQEPPPCAVRRIAELGAGPSSALRAWASHTVGTCSCPKPEPPPAVEPAPAPEALPAAVPDLACECKAAEFERACWHIGEARRLLAAGAVLPVEIRSRTDPARSYLVTAAGPPDLPGTAPEGGNPPHRAAQARKSPAGPGKDARGEDVEPERPSAVAAEPSEEKTFPPEGIRHRDRDGLVWDEHMDSYRDPRGFVHPKGKPPYPWERDDPPVLDGPERRRGLWDR